MARANRYYIPRHILAKEREVREMDGQLELPEPKTSYVGHFEAKKADIGSENTYLGNIYP